MEDSVPFQVTLDRRVHRRLSLLSRQRGQSMGSLVRESLEAYLAEQPIDEDPLFGIIGMFEDRGPKPHGSVAELHDDYLADALEDEGSPEDAPEPDRPARG